MAGSRTTKINISATDCMSLPAIGDVSKSIKPSVPQAPTDRQENDLKDCPSVSATTVPNGSTPKAQNRSIPVHMSGLAHYNRSYADVTAIHHSRQDHRTLNEGVSGNITWANKLTQGRQLDRGLVFEKVDVDRNTGVILKDDDVLPTKDVWGYSLVGRFTGRFPGTKAISILCNCWKVICKIFSHKNGWLVFKFSTEKDMECVLHGGPYFLYGKPLLLKPIPSFFTFDENQLARTPV
jgi:hypothetical protein